MDDSLLLSRDFHRPLRCEKCDGQIEYKGVGEYICDDCGHVMYDDYGKVRNYLELHKGATQAETSAATGVSQAVIRQLLKEERIEIAPNSSTFLRCEICGIVIRSGQFCPACKTKSAADVARAERDSKKDTTMGYVKGTASATGQRRFMR